MVALVVAVVLIILSLAIEARHHTSANRKKKKGEKKSMWKCEELHQKLAWSVIIGLVIFFWSSILR